MSWRQQEGCCRLCFQTHCLLEEKLGWILLLFLVLIFMPSGDDLYDDYDELGMF